MVAEVLGEEQPVRMNDLLLKETILDPAEVRLWLSAVLSDQTLQPLLSLRPTICIFQLAVKNGFIDGIPILPDQLDHPPFQRGDLFVAQMIHLLHNKIGSIVFGPFTDCIITHARWAEWLTAKEAAQIKKEPIPSLIVGRAEGYRKYAADYCNPCWNR